ncbi:MAG: hypothetical protein VXZ63_09795 [Planctomycetota bacterium]|nr:hypothetical protein [Planctomycetota bacterium]
MRVTRHNSFRIRNLKGQHVIDESSSWWDEDDETEEENLERCPQCSQWIYEDSVSCPHCGHYLTDADGAARPKPWTFVATVILCLLLVLSWIVTFF